MYLDQCVHSNYVNSLWRETYVFHFNNNLNPHCENFKLISAYRFLRYFKNLSVRAVVLEIGSRDMFVYGTNWNCITIRDWKTTNKTMRLRERVDSVSYNGEGILEKSSQM